jgi:hypothetical protein
MARIVRANPRAGCTATASYLSLVLVAAEKGPGRGSDPQGAYRLG